MVLVHRDVDGHVHQRFDLGVAEDLFIDDVLDLMQLLLGHPREMGKIEAERLGSTSEPACLTCLPSTSRRPACNR